MTAQTNEAGEQLGYRGAEEIFRGAGPANPLDWGDFFVEQVEAFRGPDTPRIEDVLAVAVIAPGAVQAGRGEGNGEESPAVVAQGGRNMGAQ